MSYYQLIEECIHINWEDLCPCEVPAFRGLEFPDSQETCRGNCVGCLLVAAELERIYTP